MKRSILLLIAIVPFYANAADLSLCSISSEDSAVISFTETLHDYGTIKKGSEGTYVFTFTNTGNIPLVLTNVRSSCGCTTPSWPKEPIAPGATGEIKVKYNTNSVGGFQKTITVFSNAKTVVLTIKGSVQD